MSTITIPAIDVHAHYGTYKRDEFPPLSNELFSGDAATVAHRAAECNVTTTVVSPRCTDCFAAAAAVVARPDVDVLKSASK